MYLLRLRIIDWMETVVFPVARYDDIIWSQIDLIKVVAQCRYRESHQDTISPLWLLLLFTALKMFSVPDTGLFPRHIVHLELLGQLL